MVVRRLVIGLLSLCWAAAAHAGPAPGSTFDRSLETAREEAYVMPGDALRKLDALKAGRSGRSWAGCWSR